MFTPDYQFLNPENPAWGSIAVLPWDAEIFGFPVAEYRAGAVEELLGARAAFEEALRRWAAERSVELIACSVSTGESRWQSVLPASGFTHVDTTLAYALPKLQAARFPRRHTPVRLATVADQQSVERICEIGFRAGRYHADARFPLELAQRRYRRWLANEFAALNESNRIYVAGEEGAVAGFTHVRVNGESAVITIGGADPAVQSGVLPFAVFIGTLEALRDSGVRRAESKLSAGNTPMLNLAAYAGSRFSAPEHVYHWHAPGAPHLDSTSAASFD